MRLIKTSRRRPLAHILLASAVAFSTASCAGAESADAPVAAQKAAALPVTPNVLFISIDDLRPDIAAYGHPVAVTPNMDAFAASGLLFESAYTQQAVCAPSRAAVMSGLRPDTTGIQTLQQPLDEEIPNAITMAHAFKNAGYITMSAGKIYHHHDDNKQAWTVPNYNVIGDIRKERRKRGMKLSNMKLDDESLLPDVQNLRHAQKDLKKLAADGKPFFYAMGFHKPHLPFYAPTDAWDNYELGEIPDPVSRVAQKGAPDYALVAYEVDKFSDTPAKGKSIPEDVADQMRMGYLAAVTYIDGLVGELLADIDALGLADDTIIVLWSDHGFKLGDYGKWAKHSNAELDIRIPMMIRVPGVTTAGSRTNALVESVDVYPTLTDLAKINAPDNLEGLSMVPLLTAPDRQWKEAAFAQFSRGKQRKGETVRTKDFRYTGWVDLKGTLIFQELYDHRTDPYELVNVAKDIAYKADVKRLDEMRKAGWKPVRAAVRN